MPQKCMAVINNRERQASKLLTMIVFTVINTNTKDFFSDNNKKKRKSTLEITGLEITNLAR